jgi:hypothetical protein
MMQMFIMGMMGECFKRKRMMIRTKMMKAKIATSVSVECAYETTL